MQPRKKWGEARIEFIPLIVDIKSLVELGYSKKIIYDKLFHEQKITMTYRWFCKLMLSILGVKKRNTNKKIKSRATAQNAVKTNNTPARAEHKAVVVRPVQTTPAVYGSDEDESFGKKQFDPDELI